MERKVMGYNFSEGLQRGILYLYKSNHDCHLQIDHLIKPEYFEFPSHSNIFTVVRNYFVKYHKLPTNDIILENVKELVRERENLEDYSDELTLIDQVDKESLENIEYLMDSVEKFARRESLKNAIRECVGLMETDNPDACEEVVRKALTVSRTVDTGQEYYVDLSDRWKREIEEKDQNRFGTIYPSHNAQLEGGHCAKELCMVVAPPGVGKSLYLVNQSVKALTEGRKVLYISLEMAEDKIAKRFDSISCCIPNHTLKNPETQLTLKKRLEYFQSQYPGSRLFIKEYPTGLANVNTIRSLLVQLRNYEDFVPDVIFVDYLELLRPCRKIDAEYIAQQRIAEELRGLAVEHNCLVWTATQTNREGKKVAIIDDTELGDSYGKIRVCDWAISLNQKPEEYDNGTMRVFVMKSRDSRQKYTIQTVVDYKTLRMEEWNEKADPLTRIIHGT
jgi:replicative DNA helicase